MNTNKKIDKMIRARLSFRVGKGYIAHNLRKTYVPHADVARIVDNIVFRRQTLEQAYDELFGEAERLYREKIGAGDNYKSYLERRRENKQNKVDYEILVMIGNKYVCGVGSLGWKLAAEILKEYMEGFQKRNPNLHVYCPALHMDEETPHLHILFVPYADGYEKGMTRQVSLGGALEAQGFKKELYQREHWKDSERKILEEIMLRHGIERAPDLGLRRAHLPIEMFKTYVENLDNRIMALPEQIKRLRRDRNEVTVLAEDLDKLELRAKIEPIYVEEARNLIEELEKDKIECKKFLKQLDKDHEEMMAKRAEMEAAQEKVELLKAECQRQKQEIEKLKRHCRSYEYECQHEREKANEARKERDASCKALKEVAQTVSMLIDPNALGYAIQNLSAYSRKLLRSVVNRSKRALKEAGVEDAERDATDNCLPEGVARELYILNYQEEEWER